MTIGLKAIWNQRLPNENYSRFPTTSTLQLTLYPCFSMCNSRNRTKTTDRFMAAVYLLNSFTELLLHNFMSYVNANQQIITVKDVTTKAVNYFALYNLQRLTTMIYFSRTQGLREKPFQAEQNPFWGPQGRKFFLK